MKLAHKEEQRTFETDSQNIASDPRREVKNLVTGQDIDIKISKDTDQIKLLSRAELSIKTKLRLLALTKSANYQNKLNIKKQDQISIKI